jgi:hypothetical protein
MIILILLGNETAGKQHSLLLEALYIEHCETELDVV